MVVSQVSYHGNPTTFNQNANDEVVITLPLQKPAYLTIQNIDIYSVQGKLVHTEQNNTIVHVESLKSGIYFLKIETNNG